METYYYGDPRNEIDKSQKKISRLWSLVIILFVMIVCTVITYFVIEKRTIKLSEHIDVVVDKIDTSNNTLSNHSIQLSSIQLTQNQTNRKIDSLVNDIGVILNVSGKGTKIMNRIEKKADTIILLINK